MDVASLRPSVDDLWAAAVAHLDRDLRSDIDFEHAEKREVVSEVLRITDEARSQHAAKAWRLRRKNGATVSVRDVLAKIAKWADGFKEIGDVAVQYDPAHAALPWGGVRFLLQIAVDDFHAYSFVLESISSLAELLCRYACVEELLLRFSATPQNAASPPGPAQELRRALLQLYVRVLTYLARARAYFRQSTAKRIVKSALLQASNLEESFVLIAAAQKDADCCFHVASVQGMPPAI
ncbi:hypothetical protein NKR23_g12492 [Pleurostoma richardsiae]|uniref:NWD NACHT-NTPase N-terminal domain-containing protein n=1 Tax=Pleurostoma richardsiae TaxID=41990 RepID=A0AA38VFD3_9PEZI|nr:hypothetical protein NKR23_g12492 [Pleurostoma richardsiae]